MERTATPFPIPKRTSLPRDARRRSLPPSSGLGAKQSKPPRDRTNREPASPEVIASLISSLSAVSLPASEHFDDKTLFVRASQSTPVSPNPSRTTFGGKGDHHVRRSGGVPPIPRNSHIESDNEYFHISGEYLHPNDAAAPPVIRTSQRNSTTYPFSDAAPIPGEVAPSGKRSSRASGGEYPDEGGHQGAAAPSVDIVDRRRISSTSVTRRRQKGLSHRSSRETSQERQDRNGRSGNGDQGRISHQGRTDRGDSTRREKRASAGRSQPVAGPTFDENFFTLDMPDVSSTSNANGRDATAPDRGRTLVPEGLVPSRGASRNRGNGDVDDDGSRPNRASNTSNQSRKEVDRTVSDLLHQTQYIDTGNGAQTSKGGGGRSKRRKDPPESMVFSRSTTKVRSPVGSPTYVSSPPRTKERGREDGPTTATGGETNVTYPPAGDESAPSPAVMQYRARDGPTKAKSPSGTTTTYLKARSISPSGRPSQETSPQTARSNVAAAPRSSRSSRLRRRSQPTEGKGTPLHQRAFSNPLGRNSTSNSSPGTTTQPPQIVVEERPSTADSIEDAVDAYLCSPRLSQKIRHPETGRVISFSEVGDSKGFVVFCCVGMGLTRYIMAFYDELALTLKLRLITPDRPGVGESEAHTDGTGTPLGWPDDVHAICQALKISKFSILAHSAGAIYALAIALRMPQQIRGRIHLLAPWIPPSQLLPIGSTQDIPPTGAIPTSQKILRALPTSLLKVANSSFMSATSSSLTRSVPKSPRRKRKSGVVNNSSKDKDKDSNNSNNPASNNNGNNISSNNENRDSLIHPRPNPPSTITNGDNNHHSTTNGNDNTNGNHPPSLPPISPSSPQSPTIDKERQSTYDSILAHTIWDLATTNANPAVDLLVCLERRQPIGFRYVDITRQVIIHHGSRDTRVPLENVKWLAKTMKRCDVRVLEGEGHGLMASGIVMGDVLMEIAREWEDWECVTRGEGKKEGEGSITSVTGGMV
ncbi:MAG: hypothetical protein M1823_000751 [Watsoniomyces obsoletus]|nr:MAG: hypothetical protein M1823_000751 [Watsoniomyces obsoletus]